MTYEQLALTEVRRSCSIVGCESLATWLLRPGETCHCDAHAEGFYRAAHEAYEAFLARGDMVFVRITPCPPR